MVSTGTDQSHPRSLPPSPPPLPPPVATSSQWRVAVLHGRHLGLAAVREHAGDMGEDLGHVAHGLGPALSEDHSGPRPEVLWVLDESEETGGLVPSPQVVLVHGDYGGCLLGAATVDWTMREDKQGAVKDLSLLSLNVYSGTLLVQTPRDYQNKLAGISL